MPSFATHKRFLRQHPYAFWYLIQAGPRYVGSIYLTHRDEVGVFINDDCRGRGFGAQAIRQLMTRHPRKRFLANINPYNETSIRFFNKLGFTHLQNTYAYEPN